MFDQFSHGATLCVPVGSQSNFRIHTCSGGSDLQALDPLKDRLLRLSLGADEHLTVTIDRHGQSMQPLVLLVVAAHRVREVDGFGLFASDEMAGHQKEDDQQKYHVDQWRDIEPQGRSLAILCWQPHEFSLQQRQMRITDGVLDLPEAGSRHQSLAIPGQGRQVRLRFRMCGCCHELCFRR
mgnify:CR=1 FL=1